MHARIGINIESLAVLTIGSGSLSMIDEGHVLKNIFYKPESTQGQPTGNLLVVAIVLVLGTVGALTLPQQPAHEIHLFLSDHYATSFFSLFDPRWYGGVMLTGYPPLVHQGVGLLSHLPFLNVERAYALVLLLTVIATVVGLGAIAGAMNGRNAALRAAILGAACPLIYIMLFPSGQLPFIAALAIGLLAIACALCGIRNNDDSLWFGAASLLAAATLTLHPIGILIVICTVVVMGLFGTTARNMGTRLRLAVLVTVPVASAALALGPFLGWALQGGGSKALSTADPTYGIHFGFILPTGLAIIVVAIMIVVSATEQPSRVVAGLAGIAAAVAVGLAISPFSAGAKVLTIAVLMTIIAVALAESLMRRSAVWIIMVLVVMTGIVTSAALLGRAEHSASRRSRRAMAQVANFLAQPSQAGWRFATLGVGPERLELARHSAAWDLDGGMPWLRKTGAISIDALDLSDTAQANTWVNILSHTHDNHLRWVISRGANLGASLLQQAQFKVRYAWGGEVVLWERGNVPPIRNTNSLYGSHPWRLPWSTIPPALFIAGVVLACWCFFRSRAWSIIVNSISVHISPGNAALIFTSLLLTAAAVTPFYQRTYDSHGHMFLASHYARTWFDLWDPRWYEGFWVTTYPPLSHQLTAIMSSVIGIENALVTLTIIALALTPLGAAYAAAAFTDRRGQIIAALVTALWPTTYRFAFVYGQLAVVVAVPLVLFCMGALHRYLIRPKWQLLLLFGALAGCTTSTHHVSTVFAAAGCILVTLRHLFTQGTRRAIFVRALGAAGLAAVTTMSVVLPFWLFAMGEPQAEIPHITRDHIFARPMSIEVIEQYVAILCATLLFARGITTRRPPLAFLSAGVLGMFLLSLGGTTPLPKILFGAQWRWLTYDKFHAYGAVLLTILMADGWRHIALRVRTWLGPVLIVVLLMATLFTMSPRSTDGRQPPYIRNIKPLLNILNQPGAQQYRYLTLGFGDQFARLDIYGNTPNIDGNYFTARRDPMLRQSGIATLDASKYYPQGKYMLRHTLHRARAMGLRWVFVYDDWYYPMPLEAGFELKEIWKNGVTLFELPNPQPAPLQQRPPRSPWRWPWGIGPLMLLLVVLGMAALLRLERSHA